MAVMRVEKNSNYTVMANYHLRDKRLSLKAKGLLSVMISLPSEWDYTLAIHQQRRGQRNPGGDSGVGGERVCYPGSPA